MTDPISPVEDELCDPKHQDPSPDLPEPLTGNDDSDDMVDGATNEGMSVTNRHDADSDDGAVEPEGDE